MRCSTDHEAKTLLSLVHNTRRVISVWVGGIKYLDKDKVLQEKPLEWIG